MGIIRTFKQRWWDVVVVDRRGDDVLELVPVPRRIGRRIKAHWLAHWKFWVGTFVAAAGAIITLAQ